MQQAADQVPRTASQGLLRADAQGADRGLAGQQGQRRQTTVGGDAAAVGAVQVQSPDRGLDVPIATQAWSATSQDGKLMIVVEPDYTGPWARSRAREP